MNAKMQTLVEASQNDGQQTKQKQLEPRQKSTNRYSPFPDNSFHRSPNATATSCDCSHAGDSLRRWQRMTGRIPRDTTSSLALAATLMRLAVLFFIEVLGAAGMA